MAWLPTYIYLLAASLLLAPTLAAVCPDSCVCSTTRDGLHRVTCSNLIKLYKYTLRQKNLNINILDLSHNNITKISHELDRLTEMVSLDLSTNGLTVLNKFLHSSKKLVHLNLAHNRLQKLSLTSLPVSISSLDLTGNLLTDVPTNFEHLPSLEHLLLEGNPLNCSCHNIISRNRLLAMNVYIDDIKCRSPVHLKNRSWLELKSKEICKSYKRDVMDVMIEDQPLRAVRIGEQTAALKALSAVANNKLEDGQIILGADLTDDDDTLQFVRVKRFSSPDEELKNVDVNAGKYEDSAEGSGFSSSLDFKDDGINTIETDRSKSGRILSISDQIESVIDTTTSKSDEESTDYIYTTPNSNYENPTEYIPAVIANTDEIKSDSEEISTSSDQIKSLLEITASKDGEVNTDIIHGVPDLDSEKSTENISEITTLEGNSNSNVQSNSVLEATTSVAEAELNSETQTESIPTKKAFKSDESSSVTTTIVSTEADDRMLIAEELFPVLKNSITEEDSIEGSGEGSGFFSFEEHAEHIPETTTPVIEELSPDPVHRIFKGEEETNITEFQIPDPPSVYQGGPNWNSKTDLDVVATASISPELTRDTTVSEQIRVTQASEVLGQAPPADENVVPHKTGTYVCIALIIVLLVGLIGFAITKGQMRKRRDQRLLRQQKRDVEKASKEMVDMNKSLLGKPAVVGNSDEKKINGKYELVPTHESLQKKGENGDVANGMKHENEEVRTDSPRDTNQNKSSSVDNNLTHQNQVQQQETSFDSEPGVPSSRKDTNSLSSEDIFVPINDDDNPRLSSNIDLDASQPLINGDPIVDSDYLSPSREYVPVYSPDMGRVRIKMTETPKPKTPVLVTRSRSNAGDIIITPTLDGNASKSTT